MVIFWQEVPSYSERGASSPAVPFFVCGPRGSEIEEAGIKICPVLYIHLQMIKLLACSSIHLWWVSMPRIIYDAHLSVAYVFIRYRLTVQYVG